MLLRVDIDGQPYVADAGFGGQTLTGPLRLSVDVEQATPHEPSRIVKAGEGFITSSPRTISTARLSDGFSGASLRCVKRLKASSG